MLVSVMNILTQREVLEIHASVSHEYTDTEREVLEIHTSVSHEYTDTERGVRDTC